MDVQPPDLVPLPDDASASWQLSVEGDAAHPRRVVLESRFGRWVYGCHPAGYDTWWFREHGGGGVITLPYCDDPDKGLLVGLVMEVRPNMGPGERLCAIGGFLDPGDLPGEAQRREAREEVGLDAAGAAELPGPPLNPNRAFFVADATRGEGVHVYAQRIGSDALAIAGDRFVLAAPSPSEEGLQLVFLPWHEAVRRTADALAVAAIARLLAAVRGPSGPGSR